MARNLDHAAAELYALYNVADHVYRMVQGAQSSLERDDAAGALDDLEIARQSAESLESKFCRAVAALQSAVKEQP